MVVSVWFGLILLILFTAGIIDEWNKSCSANKMSIAEQEKYWKGECRRRNEEYKESKQKAVEATAGLIDEIKATGKLIKEIFHK